MYQNFFKSLKEHTGILIRFDDIAPNMNWKMMDKCERLLNEYKIKPVIGVIPNNQDPELMAYEKRDKFWQIIKNWKKKNWEIAMHGYTHVYDTETNKRDYFKYGGKSEFFGHSFKEQLSRLVKGKKIFDQNNIVINTFFAPNHTYDFNTFSALKNVGISRIIDGYGLSPFVKNEIKFLPQLFYKLIFIPFGIQSTQLHINYWNENDFIEFEKFIKKYHTKIIDIDTAFSKKNENLLIKISNVFIEPILKFKRVLSKS